MLRKCTKCGQEKDLIAGFYGHRKTCKTCKIKENRVWREKNWETWGPRERENTARWRKKNRKRLRKMIQEWYIKHPEAKRRYWLKRYGLNSETFLSMLEMQEHKCMICGSDIKGPRKPQIDHDHKCCPVVSRSCGKCVRGILCRRCNHVLGMIQDNVSLLTAMIAYLRGFSEIY